MVFHPRVLVFQGRGDKIHALGKNATGLEIFATGLETPSKGVATKSTPVEITATGVEIPITVVESQSMPLENPDSPVKLRQSQFQQSGVILHLITMAYKIKELYFTLQGEGAHTGRPAVFCRFTGCNLWTGREEDRHKAICQFCDTDFWGTDGVNGGKYAATALVEKCASLWGDLSKGKPYVVCTGGEPLLQLDEPLIEEFHRLGFEVGVETNGTQPAPAGLDWICVSPKAGADLVLTSGDELKLVYPQPAAMPQLFEYLDFTNFYLQPMDGPVQAANTVAAIDFCLKNPKWRLSVQTHKLLNIP